MNTFLIFLRDTKAFVIAFAIAALLCVFFPSIAVKMEVPGDIYISLLQLCIMPLLMSSLIKSFLLIVSEEEAIFKTSKIIIVFFLGLVSVAICGVVLAKVVPLGEWISQSPHLSKFMGPEHGLKPLYVTLDEPLNTKTTFIQITQSIFTSNIFDSLSKSLLLQIIFFSFLFGGAAGCLPKDKKKLFLDLITCIEIIFKKIIEWVLSFLPIGIICIFSYRFLNLSADILTLLANVIIVSMTSMVCIILILNFFMAKRLKIKYFSLFSALKTPLIVAFSTCNSTSTMPIYITSLISNINLNERATELFGPVSLATCRYGIVFYYALLSVISAQIFSIPLELYDYLLIIIATVFTGFSAVSPGIINISLLAVILSSLSIPSSLTIILFTAIDPIIDPIRTSFTVYVNAFCSVFSFPTKSNTST